MCSFSEVVLRTMKNYKARYSLSWFRPLQRGNSPMSCIFCIDEEQQCYNGVSRELKEFAKRMGEMFLCPRA
jgi:hypothetical protein